jgi:hypothetical protein
LYTPTQNKTLIISLLAINIVILVLVALIGLLKRRVLLTAVLPLILIALPLPVVKLNWLKHLIVGAFTVYMVKMNRIIIASTRTTQAIFTEQQQILAQYGTNNHKALIAYGDDFKWEYVNPFNTIKTFRNNMVDGAGWLTALPFEPQLKSFKELLESKA